MSGAEKSVGSYLVSRCDYIYKIVCSSIGYKSLW